jgi:hypothetical protein
MPRDILILLALVVAVTAPRAAFDLVLPRLSRARRAA